MLRTIIKHLGLSKKIMKSPDFIVVGAQKSGTTYLYNLLVQHKDILPAITKEVHYFDNNIEKGVDWYLYHFPFRFNNKEKITGESSPYYLYHPLAAERIYNFNHNIKIIIILRNPVDRALSHINMIINRYAIEFNLENICNIEKEFLIQNNLTKKLVNRTIEKSSIHQNFSFIQRGIYVTQVKRYMKFFHLNENLLVLKSEDFFTDTKKQMNKIFEFLGVSLNSSNLEFDVDDFSGVYKINNSSECKIRLQKYYKRYNEELEDLLKLKMNWD